MAYWIDPPDPLDPLEMWQGHLEDLLTIQDPDPDVQQAILEAQNQIAEKSGQSQATTSPLPGPTSPSSTASLPLTTSPSAMPPEPMPSPLNELEPTPSYSTT